MKKNPEDNSDQHAVLVAGVSKAGRIFVNVEGLYSTKGKALYAAKKVRESEEFEKEQRKYALQVLVRPTEASGILSASREE